MREILFRGKTLRQGGEWLEGWLQGESYDRYIRDEHTTLKVDPETVGQYIGREDKNGVKIFEGDLIKLRSGRITKVEWFEENYSFDLNLYTSVLDQEGGCDLSEVEIIGNIHEMKHLLEVTK